MADINHEDNVVANGQTEGEFVENHQEAVTDDRPFEEVEQPVEQVEDSVQEVEEEHQHHGEEEEHDLPPPPPEVAAFSASAQDEEEVLLPPPADLPEPDAPEDNEEVDDRPVVELFVKAAVDKMKNGGCPTCHRYFVVFYVLREKGLIDLVVTTFLPENPPKEVLEISNGKHYPLVKVHKGLDPSGVDMSGIECDTVDEIEKLLERFECDDIASSKESKAEAVAEKSFEDVYKKFMVFLKDPKDNELPLIKCLEKVDGHLRDNNHTFMIKDCLTRADCYLLPSLQHIRVAGKAYKNFEIPTELRYIWHYLQCAYETDAFRESCPADREIITLYDGKASSKAKLPVRRSQLMGESRTFSIPVEATNGN